MRRVYAYMNRVAVNDRLIRCDKLSDDERAIVKEQNLGRCVDDSRANRHFQHARRVLLSGLILNLIGLVRV
jgi:hypothetical protein